MKGYLQAMEEAGLHVSQEWLTPGKARYKESYDTTRFLLSLPQEKRPTAVISLTDIGALGVLDAAKDLGAGVPDDLAVIGFDDLFISGTRSIQLTTVKIPRYEMGTTAASLLLEILNGEGKTQECRQIVLPVELIVRQTCGAKR